MTMQTKECYKSIRKSLQGQFCPNGNVVTGADSLSRNARLKHLCLVRW